MTLKPMTPETPGAAIHGTLKSVQDLKQIQKCVRCGTCRSVCPVFEELGWESSNARGRLLIIKGLSEGDDPGPDAVKSIGTCTTCGICTESCPAGIRPPEIVEDARRYLVSMGKATEEHLALKQNIDVSNNAFGDLSQRLGWLKDHSSIVPKADYVYFAGCLASYRYPETASRTFQLLKRFGVTVLPDEKCCGSPLIRTGFGAERLIDSNLEQIRSVKAQAVITGCAGCYTMLKNNYPKEFDVITVPEFLAENISSLGLKRLDLTVTYHDPCHLGRHSGIYDPPRKVIEAICDLKEMKSCRNLSRCCGGGGGVRAGYGDLSLTLAKRRLKDVPEGVDYLVTSCPLCNKNLTDAGGQVKVIDLVDLVTMALDENNAKF
jgi:fumarate reductase (CoM/CoB) subunit B